MKININDRSTQELLSVMEAMSIRSPSHLVQVLITQAHKSIPLVEDQFNAQLTRETKAV